MLRLFICGLILLSLTGLNSEHLQADQSTLKNHLPTAKSTQPEAFMWRVKHRYGTLYLVGSIHALHEKYYPLAQAYQTALQQAHKLVVELNIDAVDPTYMQALLRKKMWLPTKHTLEDYLNPKDLALLEQYSHDLNTPYKTLIKMRPWIVIEMLTLMQLKQAGFDAQIGVDRHFLAQAKQQKMPILELESAEEQINAIADTPFNAQIAGLSLALQQANNKSYLPTLVELWQQADDEALYQFIYQDIDNPEKIRPMMKRLLDDRNKKMADVLSIYLATRHTYFVVVGALHLSGPNSILKLLEKKGYQIEKIQ